MRRVARSGAVARLGLAMMLLAVSRWSSAAPVVAQLGADDPEWSGWTLRGAGNGSATGPAYDDLGLNSWYIYDGSSAAGSTLSYEHPVPPAQIAEGHEIGWILRAEVHLPNYPDAIGGSSILEFADGQRAYRLALGSDVDGDPIVELLGGAPINAVAAPVATPEPPNTSYHLYELRFNPATGLANLWINGSQWATGYAGVPTTESHVKFGSISDSDTGTSVWHRVEWEVVPVPEPSGFVTAGAALFGLLVAAWALNNSLKSDA